MSPLPEFCCIPVILVIMKNVIGERFLPIEYIWQFYQKPELITWERFSISIKILFPSEIKQENGSLPGKGSEDVVNPALTSPPPAAQMFPGMKRHTPQSFTEVISTKKRKVSTPARKNIGSPVVSLFRPTSSVAECIAKAESICKLSDVGNTFLKKKKITLTHSQAICDAVGQYNWNIVEFNESHQSFFKIMTYYYPAIGIIPEDVRHLELRRQRLIL